MLLGDISCDPGLCWHMDAQVSQTPPSPSATSSNGSPQRKGTTVCYTHIRPLPSPAASHLPQNELLGVCVNST